MLQGLILENFKAFGERQSIRFAPLTLIFGANSAGKSSILQSLLLLKQSFEESTGPATELVHNGSLVRLGSFKESLFRHDPSRVLEISPLLAGSKQSPADHGPMYLGGEKHGIGFRYSYDLEQNYYVLASLPVYWEVETYPVIRLIRSSGDSALAPALADTQYVRLDRLARDHPLWARLAVADSNPEDAGQTPHGPRLEEAIRSASLDRLFSLRRLLPDVSLTTSADPAVDLAGPLLSVAADMRRTLSSIRYLGPLRELPARQQLFSGNVAVDVGKAGAGLGDALFLRPDLVAATNGILTRFGTPYELRVTPLSAPDVSDVYALRLYDSDLGISVSFQDVGIGFSQVIPVLAQAGLSTDAIIIVEQPELHLHPRLQAELGTVFVEAVKRGNQMIVETHSEHLVLRVQRLIRQGLISADAVSVLYVMRSPDRGAACLELRLDSGGNFIDEWPDGFFEEGFAEMFDLE